ncbi:hypothetical protein OM2255_08826 [alpha proteobacterium HTCC2255]|nr:hypothetical protein OM2255_08826 [alpha proteobacterium HTCC2255] [Rhodobacterales bacterium HTCC2255]
MLIRTFIRYYKYIVFILLMPMTIQAEEIEYIPSNSSKSIVKNIDRLFKQKPQKISILLTPKIKGKSRYSFSIRKDAYYLSKKYADASDLFYLSEQIDSGLKFQSNKSKNIDIIISENNSNLILNQSILSNINLGLFLKNKDKISFGVNLNKDVIISKNALGNFGVEQAKDEYMVFNAKFVKLSNNENSEFYGNVNHEFKSDHLNVGIGNTWFDIADQFDLTLGIQEQSKKVGSELYATFGDEDIKFQVGLNQIKNNSNMNMFFNLKFENVLNKENFGTNVTITSKNSVFSLGRLSLKSFRRKNLDKLWKKHINYN